MHSLRTFTAALAAAIVVTAAAPSAAPAATVRVAPGDTLAAIAARNHTSVAALVRANRIANPNVVVAGARLRVPGRPAQVRHRVQAGQTLSAIAARYGTSVIALARRNRIADRNLVVVGRVLRVPGGGSATPIRRRPAATPGRVVAHRVRGGQTLALIAARYGTTVAAIARRNRIADRNLVRVGRVLRVPASANRRPARSSGSVGRLPPARSTEWLPRVMPLAGAPTRDEVRALIVRYSREYGVDERLARALAWQESGFQQRITSSAGAIGIMQLLPGTARWLGRDVVGRPIDPHHATDNVEAGVAFIRWLLDRAATRRQAIAGYYQGLRSVQEHGTFPETVRYVDNIVALSTRLPTAG